MSSPARLVKVECRRTGACDPSTDDVSIEGRAVWLEQCARLTFRVDRDAGTGSMRLAMVAVELIDEDPLTTTVLRSVPVSALMAHIEDWVAKNLGEGAGPTWERPRTGRTPDDDLHRHVAELYLELRMAGTRDIYQALAAKRGQSDEKNQRQRVKRARELEWLNGDTPGWRLKQRWQLEGAPDFIRASWELAA